MTNEEANNGLIELIKKIESSLLPAIDEHVNSDKFNAKKDGLDFLHVKNSLLLTYLIELVLYKKAKNEGGDVESNRLIELKTALEKVRPLEKKMRYQLEKLLSANTDSATFASGDPLSFRPNLEAMKDEGDESDGLSSDDSDGDGGELRVEGEPDDDAMNFDDDLEAAKATIQLATKNSKNKEKVEENEGVYRAPRLAAMPYKPEIDYTEKDKRLKRKMRTTELAQALKEQFSEAPEQDDVHGGSAYGKQKEAARRLAQREKERTDFEEGAMMRLTISRKDKKEQKRMMREESSNLSAISDLGNIVRGVREAFGDDGESRGRKRNGREDIFEDDEHQAKGRKKKGGVEAKNTFQKALFAGSDSKAKKKKSRR